MSASRTDSRRIRGTGSVKVRTLADGSTRRYDAIYWAANGKQMCKTFARKSEAEDHLKSALGARIDEESESNEKVASKRSFQYYALRFLRQKQSKRLLKPTTARDYHSIIWGHLIPWFNDGRVRISVLTAEDVEEYVSKKLEGDPDIRVRLAKRNCNELGALRPAKPLAALTIRNHLSVLQAICDLAVADDLLGTNPVATIERPKHEGREAVVISASEMDSLIREINPEARALTAVLCYSGLRLGEARALRWGDIDEPERKIRVRVSSSRGGKPGVPKSRSGVRDVPVREELFKYLRTHRSLARGGTGRHDFVFSSESGNLVSPDNYRSRDFRPAVERAGLPLDLRIHDLRHSFCCALISKNKGNDKLKQIQRVMGHSSILVTLDIYAHVVPDAYDQLVAV